MDRVGFAAVRTGERKDWAVVVQDDAGAFVGMLGGNRAARAAAAVVRCWVDDDGVTRSVVEGLRQDLASARSFARSIERYYRNTATAVVVPVIDLAEFYHLAPVYVYVGGEA